MESIKKAFEHVESEIEESFCCFKRGLKHIHENIDKRIEFARGEIEIRFESLRNELNRLNEVFNAELDNVRKTLVESLECKIQFESKNGEMIEARLELLRARIQSDLHSNINDLKYFDEALVVLNKMMKKLNSVDAQVFFHPFSRELDSTVVGRLRKRLTTKKSYEEISSLLKLEQFEVKEFEVKPSSIEILPNDCILVSTADQLILYSDEFNMLKQLHQLNGQSFDTFYTTCNETNKIYVSLTTCHQVIETNTDLSSNELCSSFGSLGSGHDQLCYPHDLAYHDECLYICDTKNQRISKISHDLSTAQVFTLTYEPFRIKITDNKACIQPHSVCCIYFHNLDDMSIARQFDRHCGNISEIDHHIYEYYAINKTIYCYSPNGELTEEIQLHESLSQHLDSACDGHLVVHEDRLLLTSQSKSKLLLF